MGRCRSRAGFPVGCTKTGPSPSTAFRTGCRIGPSPARSPQSWSAGHPGPIPAQPWRPSHRAINPVSVPPKLPGWQPPATTTGMEPSPSHRPGGDLGTRRPRRQPELQRQRGHPAPPRRRTTDPDAEAAMVLASRRTPVAATGGHQDHPRLHQHRPGVRRRTRPHLALEQCPTRRLRLSLSLRLLAQAGNPRSRAHRSHQSRQLGPRGTRCARRSPGRNRGSCPSTSGQRLAYRGQLRPRRPGPRRVPQHRARRRRHRPSHRMVPSRTERGLGIDTYATPPTCAGVGQFAQVVVTQKSVAEIDRQYPRTTRELSGARVSISSICDYVTRNG
jgi:hypothetical protein